MFVMDLAYRLGVQFLSYRVTFLGVLHIYNALRQLNVLRDHIVLFEALRKVFLDPAFFGRLPNSNFCRPWELLDDPLHTERISADEYRNAKGGMDPQPDDLGDMSEMMNNFEFTHRGQMLMKEGRKRLQPTCASKFLVLIPSHIQPER